jgi:hypothetical protein
MTRVTIPRKYFFLTTLPMTQGIQTAVVKRSICPAYIRAAKYPLKIKIRDAMLDEILSEYFLAKKYIPHPPIIR